MFKFIKHSVIHSFMFNLFSFIYKTSMYVFHIDYTVCTAKVIKIVCLCTYHILYINCAVLFIMYCFIHTA